MSNNVLLDDLVAPSTPEMVSLFPITVGWKVLAVLGLVIALYCIAKSYKNYTQNRYRREALRELVQIEEKWLRTKNHQALCFRINRLLKHGVIRGDNSHQHASSFGEQWLNYLTQTCSKTNFNTKPFRQWQQALFQSSACDSWQDSEALALISHARLWLKHHQFTAL